MKSDWIKLALFLVVLNSALSLNAQIIGVIKDASSGEVIEGAEIFINHSSWRSISDETGSFSLDGIFPGFFELVVYTKGYEIFQSNIRIQVGKTYLLNLEITPNPRFKSVNSKKDATWTGNFFRLKREMIGTNEDLDQYQLENTKSLQFDMDGNSLIAKTNEPLTIENKGLGFIIKVYPLYYNFDVARNNTRLLVSYEFMNADYYFQQNSYEMNRLKAYWGSFHHFLQSLVANTAEKDGFALSNFANKSIASSELVSKGEFEGYHNINFKDSIQVTYGKDSVDVSFLIDDRILKVNNFGLPLSTNSLIIEGAMQQEGLLNKLPINYHPSFSIPGKEVFWKNYPSLQEKIYLHTDRDYYYPREIIWFKAYMAYRDPELIDSMSRTVYVELFSPQGKLIDTKIYPVREGVAYGDVKLNDSLPSGQYYLRAYTNWMRNFGDSTLFVKTVPILAFNENLVWHEPAAQAQSKTLLAIETDKLSYKARQLVELKVHAADEQGIPLNANLSISVSDGVESVLLDDDAIMKSKSFVFSTLSDKAEYVHHIPYFMEPGVTVHGVAKDAKGNGIPATLGIAEEDHGLISVNTNDKGLFMKSGYDSPDSIMMAIMSFNNKGKQVDDIQLLPRESVPFHLNLPLIPLALRSSDALQRIQNTRQFKDAILLKEVVIQSSKQAIQEPKLVLNYGRPDHTVPGDMVRFAGNNLLLGLRGRVPGLQVIQVGFDVTVRFRGLNSLSGGNGEPLILLDGIPLPDAQSVSSVDQFSVDRIEIIKRPVAIYGSRGVGGVIAIFTKTGRELDTEFKKKLFKIPGYNRSSQFQSPDYSVINESNSDPDFRTTIFWKPDVKTDEKGNASVRFYTADLATRYRIVVEGLTDQGMPLRAVSYITIE